MKQDVPITPSPRLNGRATNRAVPNGAVSNGSVSNGAVSPNGMSSKVSPPKATHPQATHKPVGNVNGEVKGKAKKGLVLAGVCHSYGEGGSLSNISLEVERGRIACLLGPSGSGKTTLLRIIAGFEKPHSGKVTLGDAVAFDSATKCHLPPEKRAVGMVFQDCALFPHLTVEKNIKFGIKNRNHNWLSQATKRLDINQFLKELPSNLSGGEQQRVAFLRALAAEPKVLLLDEPFAGLDTKNRARICEATLDLLNESQTTVLMVTHDPEEAMFMADHIFVLGKNGVIVQKGEPAELWLGPKNSYVADLFGSTNQLKGIVKNKVVSTAVGDFAAPSVYSGTAVVVVIRPDGIGLTPKANGSSNVRGEVISSRNLGRFTHVRVAVKNKGENHMLHARLPGVFTLKPHSLVNVLIEKCSVFVFPTDPRD